ncbi:unnamed protein product [Acanthoscelides obtectus]|uniref:SUI1 domain-containing protein n=1 Tax=Acanthoscelides obtectus TaxID=200917 RepID=A0A9P0KEP3_ACAOB|nr:unnamed protein product [Acanthoscelides obtectus]CAK1628162.1 Eukaryotic translation initiation factor 2D [Acanthoscelides obtectus]
MFKKPLRIKANNPVKASERKQFKEKLLKAFPKLSNTDLDDLLCKKNILNQLKVVTHDDNVLQVYTIQKQPVIFDVRGIVFPTVFLLWRFPDMLECFTTHDNVMTYIRSGADLMLPGVVTPPSNTNLPKYGNVQENDIVYVNFTTNRAAIAVGTACLSSGGFILANGKGKCVTIYHCYGDYLCNLDISDTVKIPYLGLPKWLKVQDYETDFPELGRVSISKQDSASQTKRSKNLIYERPSTDTIVLEDLETVECQAEENKEVTPEEMDEVITYCFLGALKYAKNVTLPVLTSNFYKLHMLPLCPPDKSMDIKKSTFKRLKVFLEKMEKEALITIREIKKGVEAIVYINRDHPKYTAFYIPPENRYKKEDKENYDSKTDVTEAYIVNAKVLPIFLPEGYVREDTVPVPVIRNCVVKYVKELNLQCEDNPKLIKPKQIMADICKTENPVTWEEAIESVCHSMKSCFKVKSAQGLELTSKGKISPITMTVSTRSANKKVTLVDNLELFGINMTEFAKECQHGVAASTSISKPPDKKNEQLLVQGNQVIFVYKLLTDKYKVPKKYIRGLEFAPKKK